MKTYLIKVSTKTSISYFKLSTKSSVLDFIDSNLVLGSTIEVREVDEIFKYSDDSFHNTVVKACQHRFDDFLAKCKFYSYKNDIFK